MGERWEQGETTLSSLKERAVYNKDENQKASPRVHRGKSTPGRRTHMRKAGQAGVSSVCLRNRNEASVAEPEQGGVRVAWFGSARRAHRTSLGFSPSATGSHGRAFM